MAFTRTAFRATSAAIKPNIVEAAYLATTLAAEPPIKTADLMTCWVAIAVTANEELRSNPTKSFQAVLEKIWTVKI